MFYTFSLMSSGNFSIACFSNHSKLPTPPCPASSAKCLLRDEVNFTVQTILAQTQCIKTLTLIAQHRPLTANTLKPRRGIHLRTFSTMIRSEEKVRLYAFLTINFIVKVLHPCMIVVAVLAAEGAYLILARVVAKVTVLLVNMWVSTHLLSMTLIMVSSLECLSTAALIACYLLDTQCIGIQRFISNLPTKFGSIIIQ